MLQLIEKNLDRAEQETLDSLQAQIDAENGFTNQAAKAKQLWKTKGNAQGKRSFERISILLESMCVFVKTCNYCEGNEAADIEHIFPKSFFPIFAFIWRNYILACKQCNSGNKLDKCFVLDAEGNVYPTTRGMAPLFYNVAMINPRTDNPNDFLYLNLQTWKFELQDDLSLTNQNKALKTLEILALNERDYLIEGRKKTFGELYDKMDRLNRILNATSIADIENILAPYHDEIDNLLPINEIKDQIVQSTRLHLHKQLHPSVWYAVKMIASKTDPKWQRIFDIIPEALTW